ncbi:GNAT family N-acetyltransferase [Brachybacterium sp. AOP24-D1-21]|uniref:GNAT family N-acetyltransferase n=1 Tax=Brachybacterium sp. AOP24-D1-21 TaxID=3457711 RepID=UPI0040341FB5
MMTSDLTIRPVRADDAAALAVLHQNAFPEFFLSSLGTAFLKQFYLGFASDNAAISTVAVNDSGEIVGTIVGTTEPAGFFSRLLKRRLLQFGLLSVKDSLRRPRIIPRLLRAVTYRGDAGSPIDGALLSSICVRSDQQGKGTGTHMMTEWTAAAAAAGARAAYLTTDADSNDGVNHFYQELGWVLESTYATPEGRRMNRYARDLTDQKETLR